MASQYFNPNFEGLIAQHQNEQTNIQNAASTTDQNTAVRLASIRKNWPHLDPGSAVTFAQGGFDASSDVVKQAAQAQIDVNKNRRKSIWQRTSALAKGAIRTVGDVASFVPQEISGTIRTEQKNIRENGLAGSLTAPFHQPLAQSVLDQTNLGQIENSAKTGQVIDTGSGFFTNPGSKVGQAQSQAARDAWTVDGHAWTLGRGFAGGITQPGTLGYNTLSGVIDAAAAWKGDPSNVALNSLGKARAAQKTFSGETVDQGFAGLMKGLVNGTRQTTLPKAADEFLASESGTNAINKIAASDSFHELWTAMGRKPDVRLVSQLANTSDPEEVRQILRTAISEGAIRDRPDIPNHIASNVVGDVGYSVKNSFSDSGLGTALRRAKSNVPAKSFQLNDANQVVRTMENNLINARMPSEKIAEWTGKVAAANTNEERAQVVLDSYGDIAKHLSDEFGLHPKMARSLTRFAQGYDANLRAYFVDEMGNNVPVLGAVVDGSEKVLPAPHLTVEFLDDQLPNIDPEKIRQATAFLKPINDYLETHNAGWTIKSVRGLDRGLRSLTNTWKIPTLLRPAWTAKVVGEEQTRMAGLGLTSVFNHPLQAISYVMGENNKVLGKLAQSASDSDVLGDKFVNQLEDSISEFSQSLVKRGASPWRQKLEVKGFLPNTPKPSEYLAEYSDGKYEHGLAEELAQLRNDPIAQRVAGGWRSGDRVPGGLTGNDLNDAQRWFFEGPGRKFRDKLIGWGHDELNDQGAANEYIQSVFDRMNMKTGRNADLKSFIATGKIGDQLVDKDGNYARYGPALRKHIASLLEDENTAATLPNGVKIPFAVATGIMKGKLDSAVDEAFDLLMSRPSNYLSRSSSFRQFYWQRINELLPGMTQDAQKAAIRAAHENNLDAGRIGSPMLNKMARAATAGTGTLELEHADLLAKAHALDETQKLLYDISDRNQFFNVFRSVFPFGEAWKEILGTWFGKGGIISQNPAVLRRTQQLYQGAEGSGFFHKDPVSKQEVYSIPLPGLDHLMGTKFVGSVQGLNLFGNNPVMPGIGPAFQWPVSTFLPDKPQYDWVRNLVLPSGEPDTSKGIVESFAPAWLKKIMTSLPLPQNNRDINKAAEQIARYKLSSGKYSLDSTEAQQHLIDSSRGSARGLFILRGLLQAGLPSAPMPEFLAKDKSGHITTSQKLVDEYRKMQESDYENATKNFLDKYGEGALLYMQGMSDGQFQPLDSLHNFVRDNPGLVTKYPKVYGYFAPEGGQFAIQEQERQIATGERTQLTPQQFVSLANARVATMKYQQAKTLVGSKPTDKQRQLLNDLQGALAKDYPGYQPDIMTFGQTQERIRELSAAVEDPKVADSPVTGALKKYLLARSIIEKQDASFATTKRSQGRRDILRKLGGALQTETPEFALLWDRVLSRELKNDDQGVANGTI